MKGILVRVVAYPLALLAILAAFMGAAVAGARIAPNLLTLAALALAAALGIAYLLGGIIERRSSARRTRVMIFTASVGVALGWALWQMATFAAPPPAKPLTAPAQWVLADGSRIAYQRCGRAASDHQRPVVFLHGGPSVPPRRSTLETLCQLGASGFDVYLYDQRGSGASSRADRIEDYSLTRHVDDLEEIRRKLGAEQIDIVGVSWGAVVASHYVASHPGRVGRVVFVSPGILGSRADVDYDFRASASSDYDAVVLPPPRIIVAGLLARFNPSLALEYMPQAQAEAAMDRMMEDPSLEYQGRCKGAVVNVGGTRNAGANYYANLIAAQSLRRADDPIAKIAANAPPALLIRGQCDYIPRSALARYQAAYPVNRVVDVAGEGHSFLGSRPDVVVPAARCWLSDQAGEPCAPAEVN